MLFNIVQFTMYNLQCTMNIFYNACIVHYLTYNVRMCAYVCVYSSSVDNTIYQASSVEDDAL